MTPSAKYPFVCYVKLSPKIIPLTFFFRFTLNSFRTSTSLFWMSWTTSYGWTDLSLINKVIHWKCYTKSEVVAQQCSEKIMFCKTSQFLCKSICDRVPFRKTVSPPVCNCPKKDAIIDVFLWIALMNTIFLVHFTQVFVRTKSVFFKTSKSLQENTCAGIFSSWWSCTPSSLQLY